MDAATASPGRGRQQEHHLLAEVPGAGIPNDVVDEVVLLPLQLEDARDGGCMDHT